MVSAWVLPMWVGVGWAFIMIYWLWRHYRAQPEGALQLTKRGSQLYGCWVLSGGAPGESQLVHCDYLGPWLLGVYIGPQRLWVWPDSLSSHSQRALRRLCHRPGR